MSYIAKLELDDYNYLNEHPEGLKCWQTDYRLLREREEQAAYNNFIDDELLNVSLYEQKKQKNLFEP